jgi:hypothetical protein
MDSDRRRQIPPIGIGGRYLPTDPIEPDRLAGESVMEGENLANSGRYSMVQESVLRPDTREQSDWACAEVILFDRELNNAECATVERYLELKYGFKTTTDVTDGWKDQPIRIASAPNVCMDVAGGSKRNGGKIHAWKCHGKKPNVDVRSRDPSS